MRAVERFIKYARVFTTSDPQNPDGRPSTKRQFDLANQLCEELLALGAGDARVDEHCNVMASLPASPGCENAPAVGFIAHMDTSPDAVGEGVKPLLHENYDGGDVHLPNGRVIDVATFPGLKALRGKTLVTASGDTLLGADDKAGVAEIMTLAERLLAPDAPSHGRVCIGFTPDEEIGGGAADFDVAAFGAAVAYTVDGGPVGEIEYHTFNAASADITIRGVEVHPGAAKDIMVNALTLALELDAMLPAGERPQNTEGWQGYYHLHQLEGEVGEAQMHYLLRDHAAAGFAGRKQAVEAAAAALRKAYPKAEVELKIKDEYRNMAEMVEQHPELLEAAREAIRAVGLEPVTNPVRGGTDGSALSFRGLPCPNLGTGGLYYHGPNECIAAEDMDLSVEVLLGIVERFAAM